MNKSSLMCCGVSCTCQGSSSDQCTLWQHWHRDWFLNSEQGGKIGMQLCTYSYDWHRSSPKRISTNWFYFVRALSCNKLHNCKALCWYIYSLLYLHQLWGERERDGAIFFYRQVRPFRDCRLLKYSLHATWLREKVDHDCWIHNRTGEKWDRVCVEESRNGGMKLKPMKRREEEINDFLISDPTISLMDVTWGR